MKVVPIAHTIVNLEETPFISTDVHDNDEYAADILAEFAGRTCYLSYDRPNPKTASNADYLANILKQGHESVLEHSSVSFYVEGVSRNMLLELERHRFLSFSVVSTRYVNANKLGMVIPPKVLEHFGQESPKVIYRGDTSELDEFYKAYDDAYEEYRGWGWTKKEAREAAIAEMSGNLETRFVVTGNMRCWRDVLKKRLSPTANAEIRAFAKELLTHLKSIAPNSFQDFEEVE